MWADTAWAPGVWNQYAWGTVIVTPQGLKFWNGSEWQAATLRYWTGVEWVQKTAKRWDGTTWVSLT